METGLINAHDLKAYLHGPWGITRSIEDRKNNAPGRLTGRAIFVPHEAALHYQENGRLKTPSFEDDVQQAYLFEFPEPHQAQVFFRDGKKFHDLDLRTGEWTTQHLCDPDVYEGEFRLDSRDSWRSKWTIHGPRKDMTITTSYKRVIARES